MMSLLLLIGIYEFAKMDKYFIAVRIGVWLASFFGSTLIVEPIAIGIKWLTLKRCGRLPIDSQPALQDTSELDDLDTATEDDAGKESIEQHRPSISVDEYFPDEQSDGDEVDLT